MFARSLVAFFAVFFLFAIGQSNVYAKNPNQVPQYKSWQSELELTNTVPNRVIVIRRYVVPPPDPSVIHDVNDLVATYALGSSMPSLLVWFRTAINGQDAYVRLYRIENDSWVFVDAAYYNKNAVWTGVPIMVFSPNSEFGKLFSELFCGDAENCVLKVPTITFVSVPK